jgi:hypothetical protein
MTGGQSDVDPAAAVPLAVPEQTTVPGREFQSVSSDGRSGCGDVLVQGQQAESASSLAHLSPLRLLHRPFLPGSRSEGVTSLSLYLSLCGDPAGRASNVSGVARRY